MTIVAAFPDLSTITQVAGEARSADFNTLRDAVEFMADPPRCAVRLTAAQTVTSGGSDHTIEWHEAVYDSHGDMTDIAGAPSTLAITRPGMYQFDITTLWGDSTDAGKRGVFMYVNGDKRRGHQVPAVSPSEIGRSWLTNLAALDSVTFRVRQLAGADAALQPLRTLVVAMWVAQPPAAGTA